MTAAAGVFCLAVAAHAAMGYLEVKWLEFDEHAFEYGGHVSYRLSQILDLRQLEVLTHNSTNCGATQCNPSNSALIKCGMFQENQQNYDHTLEPKILRNGQVELDGLDVICRHRGDPAWVYHNGTFSSSYAYGNLTDTWKFRVTIKNAAELPEDSNDVTLN